MRYKVSQHPKNTSLLTIMDTETKKPAVRSSGTDYFFSSKENAERIAKALNENDAEDKKNAQVATETKPEEAKKPRRSKVARVAKEEPGSEAPKIAGPKKKGKLAEGDRVSYDGTAGTITERLGIRSRVKFDDGGTGDILNRQLTVLPKDAPKPEKPAPKKRASPKKSPTSEAQAA